MSQSNRQYKIISDNEDPMLSEILITGIEMNCTMLNIDNDISYGQKQLKEIEAQIGLEKAKIFNVEEHHPEVKDLSEETKQACYVWQQSYSFVKVAEDKIRQIKEALEDLEQAKKDIIEQTGLCLK